MCIFCPGFVGDKPPKSTDRSLLPIETAIDPMPMLIANYSSDSDEDVATTHRKGLLPMLMVVKDNNAVTAKEEVLSSSDGLEDLKSRFLALQNQMNNSHPISSDLLGSMDAEIIEHNSDSDEMDEDDDADVDNEAFLQARQELEGEDIAVLQAIISSEEND